MANWKRGSGFCFKPSVGIATVPHGAGAVLLVAILMCGGLRAATATDVPAESEARAEAERLAQRVAATLMQRLEEALSQGDVLAAARVCSQVAQEVTASAAEGSRARVRRTALRVRNAANRPDVYERVWLERQAEVVAEGKAPEVTFEVVGEGRDRALRHMRPIVFPGPPCAGCHGTDDEIAEKTRAFLSAAYPEDEAVGFAAGDLRGAISVHIPLSHP